MARTSASPLRLIITFMVTIGVMGKGSCNLSDAPGLQSFDESLGSSDTLKSTTCRPTIKTSPGNLDVFALFCQA